MSITEVEARIIKLSQEELAFQNAGKTVEARRVMVEWCGIRDSLSDSEALRCIDLTVAAQVPLSDEAMELLKDQYPSAYQAYQDLAEFVS